MKQAVGATAAVLLWLSAQLPKLGSPAEEGGEGPVDGPWAELLGENLVLTPDVPGCSNGLLVCHFS